MSNKKMDIQSVPHGFVSFQKIGPKSKTPFCRNIFQKKKNFCVTNLEGEISLALKTWSQYLFTFVSFHAGHPVCCHNYLCL